MEKKSDKDDRVWRKKEWEESNLTVCENDNSDESIEKRKATNLTRTIEVSNGENVNIEHECNESDTYIEMQNVANDQAENRDENTIFYRLYAPPSWHFNNAAPCIDSLRVDY